MSLQSGLYTITSVSHGDRLIGRSPIETLDLAPKQLFVLHEGASPPKTVIEKSGSGYKIKASHSPTGDYRGNVCALLIEGFATVEEWVITARPQHGNDIYTIEKANGNSGWVVNSENTWAGNTLNLKPLVSTDSIPPQFSTNSLFKIVRNDKN